MVIQALAMRHSRFMKVSSRELARGMASRATKTTLSSRFIRPYFFWTVVWGLMLKHVYTSNALRTTIYETSLKRIRALNAQYFRY